MLVSLLLQSWRYRISHSSGRNTCLTQMAMSLLVWGNRMCVYIHVCTHPLQPLIYCSKSPWYYVTKKIARFCWWEFSFLSSFPPNPSVVSCLPNADYLRLLFLYQDVIYYGLYNIAGKNLNKTRQTGTSSGSLGYVAIWTSPFSPLPGSKRFCQIPLARLSPCSPLSLSMASGTSPFGVNSLSWSPAPNLLSFMWLLFLRMAPPLFQLPRVGL